MTKSRSPARVELDPTLDPTALPQVEWQELDATAAGGRELRAAEQTPESPAALGRFVITGTLGQGGMGRVLEARDSVLGQVVAVKMVLDPERLSPVQMQRFLSEARITSQLEHPNIVPVHEMGRTADGHVFFAMKKIEGRSLANVLTALADREADTLKTWRLPRLLNAFVQVCNAMAYAHDRGVIHRDLKPDNIMLGRWGEVLVVDWGVAWCGGAPADDEARGVSDGRSFHTRVGSAVGTPGWMSPEQARGEGPSLDQRSDVWGLGAILYAILALHRPYVGRSPADILKRVAEGPPPEIRGAHPPWLVPPELESAARRALSYDREDRHQHVTELAEAVQAVLDGQNRRAHAATWLSTALEAWRGYTSGMHEADCLADEEERLLEEIEPWAPLDQKSELLAAQDRIAELASECAESFERVVAGCEQALSNDPGHPEASDLLARAYFARFEEAESAGNRPQQAYSLRRALQYDSGRLAKALRGDRRLTLRTDPPGAEVLVQRFDRRGLVWTLSEPEPLGVTPLESIPLKMGSYLLTLRAPGKRDTRYPVCIRRGQHWDGGPKPIPLFTDAEIGPDTVYVPAGPFRCGDDAKAITPFPTDDPWVPGFFASTFQVDQLRYCEFINAIEDREAAWARVPRHEAQIRDQGGRYWPRPGPNEPFFVPNEDPDGDLWGPKWPVIGISWHDATAYAAWRAERDGLPWQLPPERWWEKMARGVDGRAFTWGDRFDATLCKMRRSRAGVAQPEDVGTFASDVSVYGVRDVAGSAREWCCDPAYDGNTAERPVRGGAWGLTARPCRLASRFSNLPGFVVTLYSIRIVRPLPTAAAP